MIILLPVISKVNMARMNVLSLFVDIPNHHVIALANKCEVFMNSFHEEHNDEIDSEDAEDTKVDDQETSSLQGKRGSHKQPKNSTRSNTKFIIQFGIAVLGVMAYFTAMFIISRTYISNIQLVTQEMNVLAQAESYYSFAQNTQIEMMYNPNKPILNENSFKVSRDTII